MGNGTSAYGLRDVREATEQGQHWPYELAEAPNTKKTYSLFTVDQNRHNGAQTQGQKSSSLNPIEEFPNYTEDIAHADIDEDPN